MPLACITRCVRFASTKRTIRIFKNPVGIMSPSVWDGETFGISTADNGDKRNLTSTPYNIKRWNVLLSVSLCFTPMILPVNAIAEPLQLNIATCAMPCCPRLSAHVTISVGNGCMVAHLVLCATTWLPTAWPTRTILSSTTTFVYRSTRVCVVQRTPIPLKLNIRVIRVVVNPSHLLARFPPLKSGFLCRHTDITAW